MLTVSGAKNESTYRKKSSEINRLEQANDSSGFAARKFYFEAFFHPLQQSSKALIVLPATALVPRGTKAR
jgi:hypothetical protein